MDQKSLCELQADNSGGTNRYVALPVNKRDEFLIDYIKSNCDMQDSDVHIAELSVGNGSLSRNLAASFNNLHLSCVDISPSCLRLARDRIDQIADALSSKVEYVECNLDTDFHIVPSSQTMSHL